MLVGYIADKFRGANSWEIEQNIRRAEELALEVWQLGAACICPHANTRYFQGAADDSLWLKGDIEIMRRCDFVLMGPTWRQSEGAKQEQQYALRFRLPVFYAEQENWKQSVGLFIAVKKGRVHATQA